MTKARLQHYVPQFLLRRFTDADGALAVFDKSSERSFTTGTRSVAAEAFFYDLKNDECVLTLEPGLAKVEAQAAGIIESIHQEASLRALSGTDRVKLSRFIAIQAVRTRHQRTNILRMNRLTVKKINRTFPAIRPRAELPEPTEEDAKRISLALITNGTKEIPQIIAAKPWVLARAPNRDLYIGDNPVAMDNDRHFGYLGNIGFAVPGMEIYFPLSPHLMLYIPCPSHIERVRKIFSGPSRRLSRAITKGVDTGDPFELTPENIERANFLQVLYAGRWVFSATGSFTLAQNMIREFPQYRSGPFSTVS